MNNFNKILTLFEGKKDYVIDHKSYTSAVNEIIKFIAKNGYETSDDEIWMKITTAAGKPAIGDTKRINLELTKAGKVQRKGLQAQVYGKPSGNFELNIEANSLEEAEEEANNLKTSDFYWEEFKVEEIINNK